MTAITTLQEQSTLLECVEQLISNDTPDEARSCREVLADHFEPEVLAALENLSEAIEGNQHTPNTRMVARAFLEAYSAHQGMARKSGEPYIVHPVEVATILARMHLDTDTLAAGLLHDAIEDTPVTFNLIAEHYGERVARLVEGATKLGKIPWTPDSDDGRERVAREKEQQAESLRKMFLAMVDDIGVVLIKLADRLHNMRTLGAMPRHKQIRISQQTMEIYAPLANRLGIWQVKSELEDLAFRYLMPEQYQAIANELEKRVEDSTSYLNAITAQLQGLLDQAGIKAEMVGRKKHIYSIYRKMNRKARPFDEIYDVIGVRILVETVQDCYSVLGIVHGRWHPLPGEIDDYIATPKESMYQSLHTAVIGPDAHPVEIQIRTREMNQVAEYGIAAHWRYKEGGKGDQRLEAKIAWLRQLMDWRDDVADAEEFVESLKSDVFQDQVYCFTPAGDIIELPNGATPVDFAYRIHTQIGHQCVGATVNGQMVPLDYKLQNAQVVKIKTSKTVNGPRRDWLQANSGYVHTASAREKIRQWFRRQERDENISQGKETLERELRRLALDMKPDDVLARFPQYTKLDDFLAAIGYGAVTAQAIATKLDETPKDVFPTTPVIRAPTTPARVEVMGAGNLLTIQANCCRPVPGDEIVGYTTRGRGVVYHRADCTNIVNISDPERLVPVSWGGQVHETHPVPVRLIAMDRVGLLKDVSTLLSDERVNILSMLTQTHDDRSVTLLLTVEVESVEQLSRIMHRLENLRDVVEVRRDTGSITAINQVRAS
ncbi:MAG TPA: bifunctional (p)ppGpp synthetase/guanosine-3',5'-bis(diphosphate) 3'-pyrophosphohydrolase [Thermomicrobiales bacterium]|nr:bifunctional (p)ppGpp synthetase/guanosine-3',5'-bis(diphosphate) 3'-pyrophosphohydrolase [Thermomicrobiales bacterium]